MIYKAVETLFKFVCDLLVCIAFFSGAIAVAWVVYTISRVLVWGF